MFSALPAVVPALFAVSAACLTWWLSHVIVEPLDRLSRRLRRRVSLSQLRTIEAVTRTQPLPDAILYDIGEVNWALLALLAALGGWMLTQFLFNPVLIIPRMSGALLGLLPLWLKRSRESAARRRLLRSIRQFLSDLALALRYENTPGSALELIASHGGEALVYRRLRLFVTAYLRRGEEPTQVLDRLGKDLRSPEITRLVWRMRAAQEGGMTFAEAVAPAIADITAQGETEADILVESAPNRYVTLVGVALLASIFILLVLPVWFYILSQLSGLSGG